MTKIGAMWPDEFKADDWRLIEQLLREELTLVDEPIPNVKPPTKKHLRELIKVCEQRAQALDAESKPDDKPDDEPEPTPVTPEKDDSGEPQEPTTPVPPDAAVPA